MNPFMLKREQIHQNNNDQNRILELILDFHLELQQVSSSVVHDEAALLSNYLSSETKYRTGSCACTVAFVTAIIKDML
jgi:hypothetical protein